MNSHGAFDYRGQAEACRKAQLDFLTHVNKFKSHDRKTRPTWVGYQRSPTYQGLLKAFREALDAAYPPDFWIGFEKLRDHADQTALESAIAFLEADPYFYRSGYTKEKLLHYVKGYSLTAQQVSRLQCVVLNVTDKYYCREFRQYCNLARKLNDDAFYLELKSRLQNADPNVQKRAQWVLDAVTPPVNETHK